MQLFRKIISFVLTALAVFGIIFNVHAQGQIGLDSTVARAIAFAPIPTISIHRLPPEARTTIDLIKRGGPFPYKQDGTIFRNRERILPLMQAGYYQEYTVPTPRVRNRGARRIVTGQEREIYYTDDHYRSFKRVVDKR